MIQAPDNVSAMLESQRKQRRRAYELERSVMVQQRRRQAREARKHARLEAENRQADKQEGLTFGQLKYRYLKVNPTARAIQARKGKRRRGFMLYCNAERRLWERLEATAPIDRQAWQAYKRACGKGTLAIGAEVRIRRCKAPSVIKVGCNTDFQITDDGYTIRITPGSDSLHGDPVAAQAAQAIRQEEKRKRKASKAGKTGYWKQFRKHRNRTARKRVLVTA